MLVIVMCGTQEGNETSNGVSTYSFVHVTSAGDSPCFECDKEWWASPDPHEEAGSEEYAFASEMLGDDAWKALLRGASLAKPLAREMVEEVRFQAGEYISAVKNTGDVDGWDTGDIDLGSVGTATLIDVQDEP